jgi:hypothetical protein
MIFSLHRESWGVLSLYGLQQSFTFVHWSHFLNPGGTEYIFSGFLVVFEADLSVR